MRRNTSFLLVMLLTVAFTADLIGQQKNTASVVSSLPGGGVADPAGKTVFFPNPKGGIDALDLASGKLLWTSEKGNRPLVATGNRLFIQKGATIFVLDTSEMGRLAIDAKPIGLPDWVSVEPAYGRSYQSSRSVNGKSLWLSWVAGAFYGGGARPTPEMEEAARKSASGVVHIDLETGKIESLDAEKIAAGKFFPMPTEKLNPKVGEITLSVKDDLADPKNPFKQRRTLFAVNAAKKLVWEREIAAPVFLPPRP